MKFFIDSADISEIREANARGWVDGVTTNPTLVAKTGKKMNEVIKEICLEVKGPVSADPCPKCRWDRRREQKRQGSSPLPRSV